MEDLRNDARHDTLIISEKKNAQRNEYACKVPITIVVSPAEPSSKAYKTYSKALPVRPWMEPEEPAMMEPTQRCAREAGRRRTSGISMASLSIIGDGESEW